MACWPISSPVDRVRSASAWRSEAPCVAIATLVLTEGVTLIGIGLILGLAGAVAMAQALKSLVFGVQATDPLLLGTVAFVTGCVALLACVVPARRATRVDPMEVLSQS